MGVGGQHHAPAALPLGKKLVTHYARGWVVPIAGLDVCRKSHPYRDSIPRLSSRKRVAVLATLSLPHTVTTVIWRVSCIKIIAANLLLSSCTRIELFLSSYWFSCFLLFILIEQLESSLFRRTLQCFRHLFWLIIIIIIIIIIVGLFVISNSWFLHYIQILEHTWK